MATIYSRASKSIVGTCDPSTSYAGTGTEGSLDLKRELVSQQVVFEISELASNTALQRFGAPFRSEYGEVAPVDSDLPILRYIFVHHVRNFPFLDRAREKEFWQDKLQVVWVDIGPMGVKSELITVSSSSCLPTSIFHHQKTGLRRPNDAS